MTVFAEGMCIETLSELGPGVSSNSITDSSIIMGSEKSIGSVDTTGISESYRFAHVVKKSPLSRDI